MFFQDLSEYIAPNYRELDDTRIKTEKYIQHRRCLASREDHRERKNRAPPTILLEKKKFEPKFIKLGARDKQTLFKEK